MATEAATTTTQSVDTTEGKGFPVEKTMTMNKPPEELYRFWRNFENLPHIMDHIKSIQVLDEGRSHRVAKAPADQEVE